MTSEILFEAIGSVNQEFIAEAYDIEKNSRKIPRKIIITAAAALLLIAVCGAALIIRPNFILNGQNAPLGVNVLYSAKVPSDEEMKAIGGVKDPKSEGSDTRTFEFQNASLNEIFSALNITPLKSSAKDYSAPQNSKVHFTNYGISSLEYLAIFGEKNKRANVQMTWFNTAKGLSMGETALFMENFEEYELSCGAKALISLPNPNAAPFDEELALSQNTSDENFIRYCQTMISFTHGDVVYLMLTEFTPEEAKAFLNTLC